MTGKWTDGVTMWGNRPLAECYEMRISYDDNLQLRTSGRYTNLIKQQGTRQRVHITRTALN